MVIVEALADSVKLMWAPGNVETAWNLYYRAEGDTAWTTEATSLTVTEYAVGNLTPMTNYTFRLVPNCGNDSVFAIAEVFTPCVPLTELPFSEDFENFTAASTIGSPITNCWSRGTNYTSSSYPYRSTSYAHSGTSSIYFYASGTTYHSWLALPAIGIDIDTLMVSFAAYHTSANYSINVGVMTDPNDFNTFEQIASVTPAALSTWELFEIPLRTYTGNGQYIAFACYGATSYMYLDDIEVDYIPNCQRPYNVTATSVTTTTANIHWDGHGANFFEIEYGPAGFTRGTGMVVTSSADSVTLYGLTSLAGAWAPPPVLPAGHAAATAAIPTLSM